MILLLILPLDAALPPPRLRFMPLRRCHADYCRQLRR